ncbi:MAG: hypothetical protein E5Y63_29075 [Mesorhizobium sp.]|nr:MAG: hypothetical protein E5Y63_29075 [Mesorhizobium sp.]
MVMASTGLSAIAGSYNFARCSGGQRLSNRSQNNRFRFALPTSRCVSSVGDWRKPRRHPISPLAGEMSGRTEGGGKDRHIRL